LPWRNVDKQKALSKRIKLAHAIVLTCSVLFSSHAVTAQGLTRFVQPLSGTASSTTQAALKHGEGTEQNANTIPAVGVPFAMTQWTPQTRLTELKCIPPYFYKDSLLTGFRGTHWLSGSCTQDYGSLTIMPIVGKLKTKVADYAVSFSHESETATPAYYKLDLPAANISTELTATARCGMMQFTIHETDSLYLLIMPNSDEQLGFVQVDRRSGEVWGYNPVHRIYQGRGESAGFSGYFYIKIEKTVGMSGVFSNDGIFDNDSISNQKNAGAFAGFKMNNGEQLRIRIGTSFSSLEGAKRNLESEMPDYNFQGIVASAKNSWENWLGKVRVETRLAKDKRIFYTAMYHAMQHPRLYNDADGTYPKFSGNYELKKMTNGDYYDDFSMWDTYRAQLPLLQILQPALISNFVQSLVLKGQQGDWLPIFPCWNSYTAAMIGDHATAFISSAYANGIRNYDVQEAYRLMRKNAFDVAPRMDYLNGQGRRALTSYLQYGYIPMEDSVQEAFHKKEQVSRTLEYAFDDYALSIVAKSLGKTEDFKQLNNRALNYRNVFDKSVGLMRGRHANSSWYQPYLPDHREPYITEGTPRQYTFYVPQDVHGLASSMGGPKALENALDTLLEKNEYWHGNEPGHQIPFMYNYTASPWKTQKVVKRILAEEYSDGPGGLSGNDDAGQMSAWYVFASLGFYPLNPVSGEYLLCAPLFDAISINLSSKNTFKITCLNRSKSNSYIQKVILNGEPYNKSYLRYVDIIKGGKLEIYFTKKPGSWASGAGSRPSALSSQ
jgi:predicted alpha-1,2-mannosidase